MTLPKKAVPFNGRQAEQILIGNLQPKPTSMPSATKQPMRQPASWYDGHEQAVVQKDLELGVDDSQMHSCYDPDRDARACGESGSCRLRLKGFRDAGFKDPARYVVGSRTKAPLPISKGAFVLEVSEGSLSLQGPPGFMAVGVRKGEASSSLMSCMGSPQQTSSPSPALLTSTTLSHLLHL